MGKEDATSMATCVATHAESVGAFNQLTESEATGFEACDVIEAWLEATVF